ncbi:MAG: cyclase family protein [Clostridiales bacterium]|nr:cyclase family protein [Clostridiales bacterium]
MYDTKLWDTLKDWKSPAYEWVDLSQEVSPDTPHLVEFPALSESPVLNYEEHNCIVSLYSLVSQFGTHVDPPVHFIPGGRTLDQITLHEMAYPLCVVDVTDKVAENSDYGLRISDIEEWESRYGKIPAGAFVAMRTGWSKRPPNTYNGMDENGVTHNPGWTDEALKFLIEERGIGAIGHEPTDTDTGESIRARGWATEKYYLGFDKIQIEMLTNLDRLPPAGAIIFCTFPRVKDGMGFTARCFAIFPK